jgi:hypothetical protein
MPLVQFILVREVPESPLPNIVEDEGLICHLRSRIEDGKELPANVLVSVTELGTHCSLKVEPGALYKLPPLTNVATMMR